MSNVLGLSRSCRAAIPALAQAKNSQILVIGSAIGHQQSSHSSAYALSKAWLGRLLNALALSLHQLALQLMNVSLALSTSMTRC